MSIYAILKDDLFLTGSVLREMGANQSDDRGVVWTPGDQTVSKDGGGIALSPDPDSLKRAFAKQTKAFADKSSSTTSGSKTGPAFAYDRMLERRGTKALMIRLRRKGLVPTPNFYAKMRPAMNNPAPKPSISATSVIHRSIGVLRAKPEWLEAAAKSVARAGLKTVVANLPEPAARAVALAAKVFNSKRSGLALNLG